MKKIQWKANPLKLALCSLLASGLSALTANACSVFGHVACPGGASQAGITVNVTGVSVSFTGSATTDGSGAYSISLPSAGNYNVCVDPATLPANATLDSPTCQTASPPTDTSDVEVDFALGGDFCSTPPCPPVESCITSGFNGTPINPDNCIWFNANFTAKGVPATGATVVFASSTITINGNTYSEPGGTIHFSPSATCATTFFDGTQWVTTVPVKGSDEILLSAFTFSPPSNLRAATVTWCGDFSADTPGISISWKWGAAVYTCLCGEDYNSVMVKPTHSDACGYGASDHAGTPENETLKHCVIGGARGGGGSNFTGSWSATRSVGLCP